MIEELFRKLGGRDTNHLPAIPVPVYFTSRGVSFLKAPYISMVGATRFHPGGMQGYLETFDEKLGFANFLTDPWRLKDKTVIADSSMICKYAGQGCYGSWGPLRTMNTHTDRYHSNIKEQGHWSVFEHATFTFFIAGSRTMTMELNRHRGLSISQLSQRYVPKELVRFVERPEFQKYQHLHDRFVRMIEYTYTEYEKIIEDIRGLQAQGELEGASKTSSKKHVQQAARAFLLGCTETSGYWTANARSWRHIIDARTNYQVIKEKKESSVEPEIRDVMIRILTCLNQHDPILFGDYEIVQLDDGSYATYNDYRGA